MSETKAALGMSLDEVYNPCLDLFFRAREIGLQLDLYDADGNEPKLCILNDRVPAACAAISKLEVTQHWYQTLIMPLRGLFC